MIVLALPAVFACSSTQTTADTLPIPAAIDSARVRAAAFSLTGVSGGKDISHSGVYINTWARIAGRWQVMSTGVTRSRPPTQP